MRNHGMRWANGAGATFAAGLLLFVALPALAGPTPAQKCEAAKKAEAGKFAACRLKAESKLVVSGDSGKYDKAVAKCSTTLSDNFGKLETGGACPTTGDAGAITGFLTECSDGVSDSAEGGGTLPACGDADINVAGEECDGVNLGSRTCDSFGFTGGTLSCNGSCRFDTSLCTTGSGSGCGNGVVDGTEDCDQGDLHNSTCESESFVGGTLKCGANCSYDTSDCWNQRFVDNGDGTVTDLEKGLVWERKIKADGAEDLADRHDADNVHPWSGRCSIVTSKFCQPDAASAAACAGGVEFHPNGCSQCGGGDGVCNVTGGGATVWQWLVDLNASSFAGHSDWRVPTVEELASVADRSVFDPAMGSLLAGASCGGACTDVTDPACGCTVSTTYWSATTYADSTSNGWGVDFYDGAPTGGGKQYGQGLRAVRDTN